MRRGMYSLTLLSPSSILPPSLLTARISLLPPPHTPTFLLSLSLLLILLPHPFLLSPPHTPFSSLPPPSSYFLLPPPHTHPPSSPFSLFLLLMLSLPSLLPPSSPPPPFPILTFLESNHKGILKQLMVFRLRLLLNRTHLGKNKGQEWALNHQLRTKVQKLMYRRHTHSERF